MTSAISGLLLTSVAVQARSSARSPSGAASQRSSTSPSSSPNARTSILFHVSPSAPSGSAQAAPEVAQHRLARRAVPQDVVGIEVAVHQPPARGDCAVAAAMLRAMRCATSDARRSAAS